MLRKPMISLFSDITVSYQPNILQVDFFCLDNIIQVLDIWKLVHHISYMALSSTIWFKLLDYKQDTKSLTFEF
jgi:hypothetical protein